MGFRITTNMTMNTYRHNLSAVNKTLSDSRDKVLTHRNFNSFYEDPASATQAFRLRSAYYQTSSQLANTDDTYKKFHSAWLAMGAAVDDLTDKTSRASTIMAVTGTEGEGRAALGQVIDETANSVIQTMNCQYGDQFIFAGSDGLHVPFSWDAEGNLLYRGINVNAGGVKKPAGAEPAESWAAVNPDTGLYEGLPEKGTKEYEALGADKQAWVDYYKDQNDKFKLDTMAKEEVNVDMGMGMQEVSRGVLINGSAFNTALPGISMLGYGVDDDGDPKNVVCLQKKLGEIFKKCGEDGSYNPPEDEAVAMRLMDKLKASQSEATSKYIELDAKSKYLQTNSSRLSDQKSTLNEQVLDLEQVDLADAISTFSWDLYCYNAALKIGNQLLSQSLIDYMN